MNATMRLGTAINKGTAGLKASNGVEPSKGPELLGKAGDAFAANAASGPVTPSDDGTFNYWFAYPSPPVHLPGANENVAFGFDTYAKYYLPGVLEALNPEGDDDLITRTNFRDAYTQAGIGDIKQADAAFNLFAGKSTELMHQNAIVRLLQSSDLNADGTITSDETVKFYKNIQSYQNLAESIGPRTLDKYTQDFLKDGLGTAEDAKASFGMYDLNKDGQVDVGETIRQIMDMDVNSDGQVSQEEGVKAFKNAVVYSRTAQELIKALSSDKSKTDGLTKDDFVKTYAGPQGVGNARDGAYAFWQYDTSYTINSDSDMMLDKDELAKLIADSDLNRDGNVTRQETEQFYQKVLQDRSQWAED